MSDVSFKEHLSSLRQEVEAALVENLGSARWPASLKEAVEYSLMAGGKRLRPVLVLLACELCGGERRKAFAAACAMEMIHTYSLIHDDLPSMDDDELRRGRPTSHVVFGEALAILAGDCLLTHAFQTLTSGDSPPKVMAEVVRVLSSAASGSGMVGGQVLDLEAERGPFRNRLLTEPADRENDHGLSFDRLVSAESADSEEQGGAEAEQTEIGSNFQDTRDVDHLIRIHSMKTGALIAASLELGAICAEGSVQDRERLRQYGLLIGLAFQIADDLLDVTGSNSKLGKTTGRDVDLGKLTYPSLLGVEASRNRAELLVQQACELLSPYGNRAVWLTDLARFIVERDH
ncbi:MAG: polyprenyl synthetase family protein [Planctomycetaceae bacterium]|nr:polyprenyl synthetase family protein [Planctomycetaceae bacterium]